jgi:galactokinase
MDLKTAFQQTFGRAPTLLSRAPGRVNLLGEHVDYNGGPVLPAAIDRFVSLAAAPGQDGTISLRALDLDKRVVFKIEGLDSKIDVYGKPLPGWALYPAGVAWAMRQAGYIVRGMQAVFSSTVPIGAGLSSSAAVEMAFAVTWQALGGWQADRMTLAKLGQKAENAYVGVSTGLMDQFASAHGVENHALYFDTRSLDWKQVVLPPQTALVIADSGVRRALASSAYNERRASCEEAVSIIQKYKPGVQTLRDVTPPEFAAFSEYLPEVIRRRAEHVVKEIHRVETAVTALRKGETAAFGKLMFAGHRSLRDLYEVSLLELDMLVEIARDLPGCLGARLTGAGFGGCTVNLVQEEYTESFIQGLHDGYQAHTKREAKVYLCKASDGARAKIL